MSKYGVGLKKKVAKMKILNIFLENTTLPIKFYGRN